jgi:WXXGXW repeat (2 copies)
MRFALVVRSMLFAILLMGVAGALQAQVRVAIRVGPPVIPVYEQPICPGDGYFWTPGYWDYDYDASDYYWIPGTWVQPPEAGFLWTPPWWGWNDGAFVFTGGFWGPTIGFYGGINYGFGYFGNGFYGGRWEGGHFFYNTSVWHVGGDFHNVYNEHVDIRNDSHVSFNGHGGIDARATREEEDAARGRHVGPVAAQTQHMDAARSDPQQRASFNHGQPGVVATARPGDFKGNGAVRGGEAAGGRADNGGGRSVVHPKDLPARERAAAPNTGNANMDKKYQQQQDKLGQQQDKERQKLQAQQDKEHQQLTKQKADDTRTQQVEQKHTQQTQQLQQKHTQQTQQMQQRQAAPASHSSGGGRPK